LKISRIFRKNKFLKKPKAYIENRDRFIIFLFFVCIYFLIKESTAPLPEMLNYLSPIFEKNKGYGEILFTLSSGYLIGFSVWYLDVYIPKKSRERFAYGTLYCDYHSLAKCVNDLIIKFEAEFEIENYFIQKSPRSGATELSFKYGNMIHLSNPDYVGPLRKHISKGIVVGELKLTQIDIEFAIDKILIYSNILPMHEINSVVHLRHYLAKIGHLINVSEVKLFDNWPTIINLIGEVCYRGMVILDKANKLGYQDKSLYLARVNEAHPSLLKRT
jgi:hypothetical protein